MLHTARDDAEPLSMVGDGTSVCNNSRSGFGGAEAFPAHREWTMVDAEQTEDPASGAAFVALSKSRDTCKAEFPVT